MEKKVLIASKNPVKLSAISEGFQLVFPRERFKFEAMSVDSGVSDQPFGMKETLFGAVNRVINLAKRDADADFYTGIEGGVRESGGQLYAFAWVVIRDGNGRESKAQTGHFPLPPQVKTLIEEGFELGHANDLIFGMQNSKQHIGAVGILTDELIDRHAYYLHAVILTLIPFLKKELY